MFCQRRSGDLSRNGRSRPTSGNYYSENDLHRKNKNPQVNGLTGKRYV
jgi:hypothetical protein